MTNARWLAAASALTLALAACGAETSSNQNDSGNASAPAAAAESDGLAKLAEVRMNVDTSYLNAEERDVVNLLNQAANLMSEIYKR